jgi:hypothetical protein
MNEAEFLKKIQDNADAILETMKQLDENRPPPIRHDLHDFMRQISAEMSAEYDRIQKRATEDPGTAGDQGEENWAELLRDWLPRSFEVVTKGRIISREGVVSPQVDVLVLDDAYPKKLLNKKVYLAAGVAAAFECKVTLKGSHIDEAMENCAKTKALYQARSETAYKELHSPIVYGLLSHSHVWKGDASTPEANIASRLKEADQKYVNHPRFQLDLLCVADLATWSSSTITSFQKPKHTFLSISAPTPGSDVTPATCYMGRTREDALKSGQLTPIGILVTFLSQKLAWERPLLRNLTEYYQIANLGASSGQGGPLRVWPSSVYTDSTRQFIQTSLATTSAAWDEWSLFF